MADHCQNVCGRTVPDGYRLCPTCQAGANERVQLVRAELEAQIEELRAELQAANLTIEARSARLAEARAELADLKAVAAIVFLRNTHSELDEMITRYRARWQSGEKEDES